jgi:hypothetical protein
MYKGIFFAIKYVHIIIIIVPRIDSGVRPTSSTNNLHRHELFNITVNHITLWFVHYPFITFIMCSYPQKIETEIQ